jgi:multidrug efflux pump subunit AcrA (membrane-fusion protein)
MVTALMVPDEVIQSDQARKTVMVVAPDGTVAAKPVELGPVVRGLRIVRAGLAPGTMSSSPIFRPRARVRM